MKVVYFEDNELIWKETFQLEKKISPFYSPIWIDYMKEYVFTCLDKNLSFVIVHDGKPACLCPLFLESHGEIKSFSYSGSFLKRPHILNELSLKSKKIVEKFTFDFIDQLAKENDVKVYYVEGDPLSEDFLKYNFNDFIKFGFLGFNAYTNVIDLENDSLSLWREVRKGHKHQIKRAEKILNIKIWDFTNAERHIHDIYKDMHVRLSGNRNTNTYEFQYTQLINDQAIIVECLHNGVTVSCVYFMHSTTKVLYASVADILDDYDCPVSCGHFILWEAIKYYKKRKFTTFETGQQYYFDQFFNCSDDKNRNISLFKRGFGGRMCSVHRGVKFYDKEIMNQVLLEQTKKMLDSYF